MKINNYKNYKKSINHSLFYYYKSNFFLNNFLDFLKFTYKNGYYYNLLKLKSVSQLFF